jgi:hypothetical protein
VLVAAGVKPTTELAASAGADLGAHGAIRVDRRMATSVPNVWAAGDCVETWHRVLQRPTYLPLGTTAHKQGRVAGENAVGGHRVFEGSVGTQVVKVFDLAIARTGLRDVEARQAGFDPITVETETWDHKAYYPGAPRIRLRVTGDRQTGQLLGAQILGPWQAEVAKRIDVYATALFAGMSVDAVSDLDLSYTPPFGSPWDAVQDGSASLGERGMSGAVATNRVAPRPVRAEPLDSVAQLIRRALAEFVGTALLLIAVIGSGIAAQTLSPNDTGLELLENAVATGAALVAIILAVGSVSGAHLNPVVSCADALCVALAASSWSCTSWLRSSGSGRGRHRQSDVRRAGRQHVDTRAEQAEPVAWRNRRDVRPAPGRLRPHPQRPRCSRAICRRRLHHGRLLLHVIDELREPGRHAGQNTFRHVRGHRASIGVAIHRGAAARRSRCLWCGACPLAADRGTRPRRHRAA